MLPKVSEEDFVRMYRELGPRKMARRLNSPVATVRRRRQSIERRTGEMIRAPTPPPHDHNPRQIVVKHPPRQNASVENGVVLVGSDAHYWPGEPSAAHRAFVHFAAKLKPAIVVMNGDVLDGSTVSRHPPIGWENRPTLVDEIIACQTRLREITNAAKAAKFFWTLGNHDGRFENRIATVAPEFAKVHGVHLKDHFGDHWQHCWSIWINDRVVIKHRFKGGLHATHSNAMWSGKSILTGHLHSLKVTPLTDYNGTRWGVDTGTLAVPYGGQFIDYTEDNPVNWRSGFAVLTFRSGELLWPEVVHVRNEEKGEVEFRGEVIKV